MALSNYSELQAEITAWMHREDLSARIPTFIKLATDRIARELRVWRMEDERSVSLTAGDEEASVNSLARAVKSVRLTGANARLLGHIPLPALREKYATATSGVPCEYSFQEGRFIVAPVPSEDCTLSVVYTLAPADLSDAAPTNTVLTYYPSLYLQASLVEGYRFVRHADELAKAEAAYQQVLESANRESRKMRASGTPSARQDFSRRIP